MKLADMIPYRLQSPYVMDYENAVQAALDDLEAAYDRMTDNLHIDTASEWLPLWEKAYGVTVDATKDDDTRRAKVRAKMRGVGTTTLEMMRQVSAPYSEEPPEVIEDNPAYTFYIYLYNTSGYEPENLGDLKNVIEEIKPAHLDYQIVMLADIGLMDLTSGCLVQVTDEIDLR